MAGFSVLSRECCRVVLTYLARVVPEREEGRLLAVENARRLIPYFLYIESLIPA